MKCAACLGRRVVASIDGDPRPCSRCDWEGFNAWAKARSAEGRKPDRASAAAGRPAGGQPPAGGERPARQK